MPIGGLRVTQLVKTVLIGMRFVCALGVFVDWQHDNAILRHQGIEITRSLNRDSARIRAINDWVYQNRGFGKMTIILWLLPSALLQFRFSSTAEIVRINPGLSEQC